MKLFVWVQGKLSGGKKPTSNAISPDYLHTRQEPCEEEFSDWPNGLLTIGTFGNGDLNKDEARQDQQDHTPSPSQDQSPQDLTIEEVWKLQQQLNSFLNTQPQQRDLSSKATGNSSSSGLYRSISCPLSSEIIADAGEIAELISHEPNTRDDNFQETNGAVVSRKSGKENVVLEGAKRNGIGKRSMSLLMKKMFACKSGFNFDRSPVPSLKDPLPETRMEKILRAILHKKIYPQSSGQALSAKRCLEQRPMPQSSSNQEQVNEETAKSKWDRTDSEYIVLEI